MTDLDNVASDVSENSDGSKALENESSDDLMKELTEDGGYLKGNYCLYCRKTVLLSLLKSSKYHICQSILLFSNMCPHKADNPKVREDNQNQSKTDSHQSKNDVKPGHVHITLLNTKDDHSLLQLVEETFGMAVLDSGCMITVAGKFLLKENVKMLPESNKKCAEYLPTEDIFWFGDGKEVVASKRI